jgi:hypothetical protein
MSGVWVGVAAGAADPQALNTSDGIKIKSSMYFFVVMIVSPVVFHQNMMFDLCVTAEIIQKSLDSGVESTECAV